MGVGISLLPPTMPSLSAFTSWSTGWFRASRRVGRRLHAIGVQLSLNKPALKTTRAEFVAFQTSMNIHYVCLILSYLGSPSPV